MIQKMKKAIILIISLFLGGNLVIFIGLTKGRDMAIKLFVPITKSSSATFPEFIIACTYVPIILGASLIILSIIFSTVLFLNWIKRTN